MDHKLVNIESYSLLYASIIVCLFVSFIFYSKFQKKQQKKMKNSEKTLSKAFNLNPNPKESIWLQNNVTETELKEKKAEEEVGMIQTLRVSHISRCSTTDGPGCRTIVYFKGCSLRCDWCHNPETQNKKKELFFDLDKCNSCGLCVDVCQNQAIKLENNKISIDRNKCKTRNCFKCVDNCYSESLSIVGKDMTISEIFSEIIKDKKFMDNSGGGVTFSGGEPLFQNSSIFKSLLKMCKAKNIHVAVDTCGAVPFRVFEKVAEYVDLYLYDLKHTSSEKVMSKLALENAKKIASGCGSKIWFRIPLIPEFNANEKEIRKIGKFINSVNSKCIESVHLFPYHIYQKNKYRNLGREYFLEHLQELEDDEVQKLSKILEEECGFHVFVGGVNQ